MELEKKMDALEEILEWNKERKLSYRGFIIFLLKYLLFISSIHFLEDHLELKDDGDVIVLTLDFFSTNTSSLDKVCFLITCYEILSFNLSIIIYQYPFTIFNVI